MFFIILLLLLLKYWLELFFNQPTYFSIKIVIYVVELLGHGFQYGTPYTARFFPTRGSASTKLHALC